MVDGDPTRAPAGGATALPPIHMLWFGRPLGDIERLSIASFLHHGHDVRLFTYGDVGPTPKGTRVLDAGEVLPSSSFERLRSRGVKPALISDYFRYLLLFQRGGWWVDADVVCVRPFDFASEIVYGWQDERVVNSAALRLPVGHRAAELLIEGCLHPNRWMRGDRPRRLARKTRDALLGRRGLEAATWGATGPAALTAVVRRERMVHHATSAEAFYPVSWEKSAVLFRPGNLPLAGATFAVHLWNEVRGSRQPEPGSPIRTWMETYGV